jgi:hypothetical protein
MQSPAPYFESDSESTDVAAAAAPSLGFAAVLGPAAAGDEMTPICDVSAAFLARDFDN